MIVDHEIQCLLVENRCVVELQHSRSNGSSDDQHGVQHLLSPHQLMVIKHHNEMLKKQTSLVIPVRRHPIVQDLAVLQILSVQLVRVLLFLQEVRLVVELVLPVVVVQTVHLSR